MDESGSGASFASSSTPLPVEMHCHSLRNREIVAFLYYDSKLQASHNSKESAWDNANHECKSRCSSNKVDFYSPS